MTRLGLLTGIILLSIAAMLGSTCTEEPTPPVEYSIPELEYRLLAHFDNVFWCDPDFYPIGGEEQEEENALEQFPIISANTVEFSAILAHLGLPEKSEYSDQEKLQIYREHKKLTYAVQTSSGGDPYDFSLRVGEEEGEEIVGTITKSGVITILSREPSINTCPICLTKGTLIDTPGGLVPVEQLCEGMPIWTVGDSGEHVAATVVETAMTPVPSLFHVVRVGLNDGRSVTAAWGHPTAEGRALGEYQVGDILGGALVIMVEHVIYEGGATYDILPGGPTGLYWANGMLLQSTLAPTKP
jgi:hypothetical protein